jgi:predicted TPR repeat methyltransferase
MPTSHWSYITKIVNAIKIKNPQSMLEIGLGFGKYGILAREYLEVYGANRWQKKEWKVRIDGVEIYTPYITDQIKHYYDTIYNEDIVKLFKENKISNYDLILMTDVLEHLNKEDGKFVFEEILKHSKTAIFAVPLGDWRYEFDGDNKHESHISVWEYKEFIHPKLKDSKTYPVSGKKIGVFIYENQ